MPPGARPPPRPLAAVHGRHAPLRVPRRLLRSLRSEISSCRPEPAPQVPPSVAPFAVDDRTGEQYIRLRRAFGEEEVRVDASMVDGAVAPTRSGVAAENGGPPDRMHIKRPRRGHQARAA
ncbi:hypothetical protein D1007_11850 [Hordeum vulgare]|nr:hypothetical protein D1007_11850 [Hordeum vulgare]